MIQAPGWRTIPRRRCHRGTGDGGDGGGDALAATGSANTDGCRECDILAGDHCCKTFYARNLRTLVKS
jgi:hypothetical protein